MASGSNCCLDIVMDAPKDDDRESNLDESGVGVVGRSTSNMAAVETISQCNDVFRQERTRLRSKIAWSGRVRISPNPGITSPEQVQRRECAEQEISPA